MCDEPVSGISSVRTSLIAPPKHGTKRVDFQKEPFSRKIRISTDLQDIYLQDDHITTDIQLVYTTDVDSVKNKIMNKK